MQSAAAAIVRDPAQLVVGLAEVSRQLCDDLGVTVVYGQLPDPDDASEWVGATRTIHIAHDISLEDEVTLLIQLWLLLVVGPEATTGRAVTHLQLVPPPRTALAAEPL